MKREQKLLFIINPAAGVGRAGTRFAQFERSLARAGICGDRLVTTQSGQGRSSAQRSASQYDVLVAVGGDGTCLEVVSGILASGSTTTALGILPFGTGNDAAAVLGIRNEADALRAITAGHRRAMDVIRVDHLWHGTPSISHALLFAGVGIAPACLERTTATVKRLFGQRLAYPIGLIRALWTYRSPEMHITCDDERLDGRFLFVGASNSELAGGGMRIAPGARIDDGRLNVNLVAAMGRFDALGQVRRLCRGTHTTHPQVRYFTALDLTVDANPPLPIAADGELIGHTPVRFAVRPKTLHVLVPH